MSQARSNTQSAFSRRNAIKGLSMAAATMAVAPKAIFAEGETPAAAPTKKMAIIGGGMGGIATAYFCDSDWKVDLFEAREKLGGNASTSRVDVNGKDYSVDLGAQFFHPNTHPLYWSLLQEIEALNLQKPDLDLVREIPATLSIFAAAGANSRFTSTQPFENIMFAIAFANFTKFAREAVDVIPWEMTIEEWIASIALDETFKKDVLLPWLTSLNTGEISLSRKFSARSTLNTFVKTFPEVITSAPSTYNSSIGLDGYLQLMVGKCKNMTTFLNSPVEKIEELNGEWFVFTAAGRQGPYASVVVNAAPYFSKSFLKDVNADLFGILNRFQSFPSRVVMHRDPAYVLADQKYWCSHNAAAGEEFSEGSVWMGSGQPEQIQVFKSWANKRAEEAKEIIADRTFEHTYGTAQTIQATRELNAFEMPKGLHFSGHFMAGFDLQETALYSALKVSRKLAPESIVLSKYEARLAADGLSAVNYDLV